MLLKVMLGITFGRGAARPLRAACIRIGCLWIIAALLGYAWAKLTPPLPFMNASAWQLIAAITFVVELVVTAALAASVAVARPEDTTERLFSFLPLSRRCLWSVLLLPAAVTAFLAVSFVAFPLASLAEGARLPLAVVILNVILGSISAFGLFYGLLGGRLWQRIGFGAATVYLQYTLTSQLYKQTHAAITGVLLFLTFAGLAALFVQSSRYVYSRRSVMRHRTVRTAYLPRCAWFIKKGVRNTTTALGVGATFAMAALLAILCVKQKIIDPSLLSGTASVLGAALAADVRALCLRTNPPEIVALKGSLYFGGSQLVAAFALCGLAVSPLLILMITGQHHASVAQRYGFVLQPILGICAGVCAGTIIVPVRRDITAQCSATLFAVALLMAPQMLLKTLYPAVIDVLLLCLSVSLVALTFTVEYKRNTYTWRKYEPASKS